MTRVKLEDATTTAMRAAKLLDYIKAETRWQLIASRSLLTSLDAGHTDDERRALLADLPAIRHRRVPPAFLVSYYEYAADQATRFAMLIATRREREFNRRVAQ
jgi:hypothetical protein